MAPPFTILVVDDEPDLRDFIARILTDHGLHALTAPSSYHALQILAAQPVDVLLTDIVMPGKNGVELAAEAKRLRPEIKVLFVTAYAPRSTEQAAMRLGPALLKPVRAAEIVREIKALLPPFG